VFADAMEPIPGVVKVRFAAVHDRVEVAAGGGGDLLSEGVGVVEVIVPEQGGGAERGLEF
jgi:hypothetical protein